MPNLPSGTVTFVFSDIEGSTALLKQLGNERYAELLATHRRLVRETFGTRDGHEIDTQGDAFFYSFTRAREAVAAAVAVQRAHNDEKWPDGATVRLRLGLHTGEPAVGDEGYTGLDVVRASRIAAVGRGGQVLLSDSTRALVADDLPDGVSLRSLGERQLRGLDRAEPLHELRIDGIEVTPEPSRALEVATPPQPPMPIDHGEVLEQDSDEAWPVAIPRGALAGMPDWLRRTAVRAVQPSINRTSQLIEERVLAELEQELDRELGPGAARSRGLGRRGFRSGGSTEPAGRSKPRRQSGKGPRHSAGSDKPARRLEGGAQQSRGRELPPPQRGSLAEEILQLQRLRDSGALSAEQYAKAVDRLVEDA